MFFSNKSLRFKNWYQFADFAGSASHVQRELVSYVTQLNLSQPGQPFPGATSLLANIPKLRGLSISLDFSTVMPRKDKVPWTDQLNDMELLECYHLQALTHLRGIPRLDITKSGRADAADTEEVTTLSAHLDRAEALIRRENAKPRAPRADYEYPMGIGKALALSADSRQVSNDHALVAEAGLQRGPTLTDDEVPDTPDGFVKLFLSRPQDMLAWARAIKKRASSREGKRSPVILCPPLIN